MVAGLGGLYQLTQLNPEFNILADSAFCPVNGIIKTTESFLRSIEEEYANGFGLARAATFVACRQAAEWGMKVLGSYRRLTERRRLTWLQHCNVSWSHYGLKYELIVYTIHIFVMT